MTYDEWKKARVEAAVEAYNDNSMGEEAADEQGIQQALEAADAEMLPSEGELESLIYAAIRTRQDIEGFMPLFDRIGFSGENRTRMIVEAAAKDVIDAIRPWIAMMIEKGKGV